jgi:uncharacterized protein YjbI with pentapeptide repeats
MANPEHVEILKQGVKAWNNWRKANPTVIPDLSGHRIESGDLGSIISLKINATGTGFDYLEAIIPDFNNVNLSNTQLQHVRFSGSNLRWANFSGARLFGVDFVNTDLRYTTFRSAYLSSANFFGAKFDGVDFAGTALEYASFGGNDLSEVKGLETIRHHDRSSIDIETIYKSRGRVPVAFLRGCGLPEPFIVQIPALIAALEPIQFYSCFISYSSKDQDFANRLHADLQNKGVRCWFAPEDLKIGDRIRDRIDESIRLRDKLLLILSENSIVSDWVEHEVESALEEERQKGRTILFPIRLDDAAMDSSKAWAALVRRTRHVGDFTRWQDHNSYQKAFDRLLRDLKAEEKPA